MNILYIANIRLPTEKAHGAQIMKTCEALAAHGAHVELVVPTRANALAGDPFAYYGVAHNFAVTRLHVPDWVRFGAPGFMASLLLFSERVRWLKTFWTADVVYSRDAAVLLQYVLLGRRLVYEAHAKPSVVSRFVARRADRVVVISRALRDAYEAAGVSAQNILVAPDAVDLGLFAELGSRAEERAALGLPAGARILVYAGHLYERKGAEVFAQAAAHLGDAWCVFVGGTPADIKRFRARWSSQKNIHAVGHVPQTRVAQYLRAADALVLPNSAANRDASTFTSPMKLFEYMASGTPIVASDVPAVREILSEQEATFFTPDDVASLADGVVQALAPGSGGRAAAAKQKAEGYTWDRRADSILGFVSALL